MNKPYYEWPEELISLLGTMSDGDLERKAGIPRDNFARKRRELGVKAFVKYRPWSEFTHLFTVISDQEIAELRGCSQSLVSRERKKIGAPAYTGEKMVRNGIKLKYRTKWSN